MKKLRLVIVASGALVGVAGFLIACSSDDTIITDPVPDGGGPDQNAPETATGDVDASPDAPTIIDAGLTLENYETQLAAVLCRALAKCCYGNADLDAGSPVDGGTFALTACRDFYKAVGFESSAGELPTDKNNLVLDVSKGNECVTEITDLTCDTPGTDYTAMAKSCFAAVVGKLTAGQPCDKSIECAPGNFCSSGDGGAGVCAPLRAVNAPCGDWFAADDPAANAERAQEACSYRGKGVDTGRYCDVFDFDVTFDYRPQADWKCVDAVPADGFCANNAFCKDALCDDDQGICVSPKAFFTPTPPGSQAGCGKFATPP